MSFIEHTKSPIVTGSSVLAIKYKEGVLIVSDTLASYGSSARFPNVNRLDTVNDQTIVGASGELSDLQYLWDEIRRHAIDDFNNDGSDSAKSLHAKKYASWVSRIMYNRRSKMDPLFNSVVVIGDNGYIATIDLYGTKIEGENFIATGFGSHLSLPILRERWVDGMSFDDARSLLEECMRVLFYRDCRASSSVVFGRIHEGKANISEPVSLKKELKWDHSLWLQQMSKITVGGAAGSGW